MTKDEAQPAQEPVVCRFCRDERGCWAWQCDNCGEIDDSQEVPPPQRKPLTDEQRRELMSKAWNEWLRGKYDGSLFAWYLSFQVEAAHGIKEKNT